MYDVLNKYLMGLLFSIKIDKTVASSIIFSQMPTFGPAAMALGPGGSLRNALMCPTRERDIAGRRQRCCCSSLLR